MLPRGLRTGGLRVLCAPGGGRPAALPHAVNRVPGHRGHPAAPGRPCMRQRKRLCITPEPRNKFLFTRGEFPSPPPPRMLLLCSGGGLRDVARGEAKQVMVLGAPHIPGDLPAPGRAAAASAWPHPGSMEMGTATSHGWVPWGARGQLGGIWGWRGIWGRGSARSVAPSLLSQRARPPPSPRTRTLLWTPTARGGAPTVPPAPRGVQEVNAVPPPHAVGRWGRGDVNPAPAPSSGTVRAGSASEGGDFLSGTWGRATNQLGDGHHHRGGRGGRNQDPQSPRSLADPCRR